MFIAVDRLRGHTEVFHCRIGTLLFLDLVKFLGVILSRKATHSTVPSCFVVHLIQFYLSK